LYGVPSPDSWHSVALRSSLFSSLRSFSGRFGRQCRSCAVSAILRQPVAHISRHSMAYDYGGIADGLGHALLLAAYLVPAVAPFFISTAPWSEPLAGWTSSVKKPGGCDKDIVVDLPNNSLKQSAEFSFSYQLGNTRIDAGLIR
jgi:hypothetical protein